MPCWLVGCALGPRPKPQPPDISREKAIRGSAHFEQRRLDRAERDFKSAFYLDQAEDRAAALARDYSNLAALALRKGDDAAALECLARSTDIHRRAGNGAGLARSLAAMAAAGGPSRGALMTPHACSRRPWALSPRLAGRGSTSSTSRGRT